MAAIHSTDSNGTGPDRGRRRLLQGALLGMAYLTFPRLDAVGAAGVSAIVPLTSKADLAVRLESEFKIPEPLIRSALARAKFTPSVIERMQRPYEARPYAEYRPLFVNTRLARMGEAYMARHKAIIMQAERLYGVQGEIIAAILGMETHYGRSSGRDRVLDALYTLSTGYPKRAAFFRRELGNFLLLCQEEHLRPDQPLGSYAGAFGATQFIPSSYRHYAVDADGDGRRNVWDSPADIIHSVANYFHLHGWDAGRPVARWMPALPEQPGLDRLRQAGIRQWQTLGRVRGLLPSLPSAWHDDDRVSLVSLETAQGRKEALIHYNFYVITRWNHSYNYAMAASELAAMLGCGLCRTGA